MLCLPGGAAFPVVECTSAGLDRQTQSSSGSPPTWRTVTGVLMFLGPCLLCVHRDADDAVYGRDGYDYDGYRLRVEFPRSGRGSRGGFGGIGGAPRGRYGPPSRRSEYRVIVSGEHADESVTCLACVQEACCYPCLSTGLRSAGLFC